MDLLTPDFGVFFWQSVILFIVLFILKKFAWKPALGMIKNREEFVTNSINKANECNIRVAQIEEECSTIVKNATLEKNKIIEVALDDRKKIIEKAESDAKVTSDKIISVTKKEMDKYKTDMVKNSKSDIISLSVQIAEKLLCKELEGEDKQKEFLDMLMEDELKDTNVINNETL